MTGGTVNDNIIKSGNSIQGAGICNQGTTTVGGTAGIRENQMTRIDDVIRENDKDGGGIYTGGTLIVEGNAKIIKNQTAVKGVPNSHGGGIYVSNGTAVLRGNAEVKDNEVGSYGAGICCICKLSVSGNVQITGNEEVYSYGGRKTSNVYFTDADSMPIAVNGALTDSACIGVLLRDKLLPTETNTVTIAEADTETSADTSNRIKAGNFTSDNNKYVINMTDNGSKAVLSKHEHTWTYSLSTTITENDTITAECSECSKIGICHYSKSGEMVRPNDAGTYTVKINIAEGKNYAAATGLTAEGWNFTINPREVTLTWNNTENRTYGDGKTVTATAGNLVNGDEISVDVTDGNKNEIGTHTATATGLIGGKAGNYKLPDDNTKRTATYNVNKGRLELDNKELTMPVYKGVAKRYTYDFANELPTLTDGLTFGNIRYIGTLSNDFDEHWINKGCVELNGSVLSINTSAWDEGTQILEYVVTVKSDNYEDFTMTLKVNAEDKKMADLSIEINGWSYGSGGFNEPVVLNEPADAKRISTVYKNKATGKEITPNGKTDDAGEYTVTVRHESDDTVYTGTKDFIINPRHLDQNAVVVPAGVTANKIYDGATVSNLTEMSIVKDRLVTEEDGALRIVGTSEYANPNAGKTMLDFNTNGTIKLSDPSSSAKPSNYSTTPPTFTAFFVANILQRELDFTADSVSKIYGSDDAAAEVAVSFLPVSGKDKTGLVDGETLVQGVDYDVTAVFSKTEVGEDNNVRVTVTLKDTQKARNYTLNTSEIIVTGTINPKPTPVLDGNVTLSPDKITYGEPLSNIKITGTMKDPITNATVDGTFSWQLPGDTILDASTLGHNVGWKFTPKDGRTYAEVTDIATVKVDKATQHGEVSMAGYTYGQTPGTPTLTDRTGDMNNYLEVANVEIDVTVVKADGNNLKTEELTQKYTDTSEHTYTPDWSGLPMGQNWSYNSEYSVSTDSTAELTPHDFAANGSLLTYAVSGGKAGDVITVTLKASCANYEDFTITLNITLADRDAQAALLVIGETTVVYGHTLTFSSDGGSDIGEVSYSVINGTGEATITPDTAVLTPVKVGTVNVIATKAGDNDYKEVASALFEITITHATPTGEPKYTKITTFGKTLQDAALTLDGSNLNPSAGNLEWVDDDGNVLPNNTNVEANKTYKWRFTPDDGNYTTLIGEAELYHMSYGGGGGGTTR